MPIEINPGGGGGGGAPSGPAGGDLSGTYPNPSVFEGHLTDQVAPAAPAAGTLVLQSFSQQGFSVPHVYDAQGNAIELTRDNMFIARNVTGASIARGAAVYISGTTGAVPQVAPAKADSSATMPAVGLMYDATANNGYGRVLFIGDLERFDTSGFAAGDKLYVSAASAGALVNTAPTTNPQLIGWVLASGVGNGVIYVHLSNSAALTAADTSVVVGGTPSAPTVRANTLDVIAADHPPVSDWSNNSHKITSVADPTLAQDAATKHYVDNVTPGNAGGKGHLTTATAVNTPADLAPGSDGTVLTADSTQAEGLKWSSSSAARVTSFAAGAGQTFTMDAATVAVEVICIGAGGGGAGGASSVSTSKSGGGGGGGGSVTIAKLRAADVSSPVTVNVGTGGTGGAGGAAGAGAAGTGGGNGGSTNFGTYLSAYGGGGGQAGTNANNQGGSGAGTGSSAVGTTRGNPNVTGNAIGGAAGVGGASTDGSSSEYGGAGGAGGTAGSTGHSGGSSIFAGPGGGSGGGVTAGNVGSNGGAGGAPQSYAVGGGGTLGTGGAAPTVGGNGAAGPTPYCGAGGGGGGAGSLGAGGGKDGGTGGTGAGGGGGGAGSNNAASGNAGGAGKAGGAGRCIVIEYA